MGAVVHIQDVKARCVNLSREALLHRSQARISQQPPESPLRPGKGHANCFGHFCKVEKGALSGGWLIDTQLVAVSRKPPGVLIGHPARASCGQVMIEGYLHFGAGRM